MNVRAGRIAGSDARTATGDDLWALGVLPLLAAGSLAGFLGIYWDISWHIDKGRDTFFTPPHNFIYGNLAIVVAVTLFGLWRDRRQTPAHVPVGPRRLHAGLLIAAAGGVLVLAFAPLDDLWHRMFGVDVTLWGPMHLVGILGTILGCLGGLVCAWLEGATAADPGRRRLFEQVTLFFAALLVARMVLVLGEYEFMVPQYPMVLHPVLLASLPVFPLVLIARLVPIRWGATLAAVGFTALRLGLAGWLLAASHLDLAGAPRPAIPLLIPAGVAVDLLAARRLPGWLVGLLSGAVTLIVNLVLIDAWGPPGGGVALYWSRAMFLPAILPGLLLSALMGAAAVAVADSLHVPDDRPGGRWGHAAVLVAVAVLLAGAVTFAALASGPGVIATPQGPVRAGDVTAAMTIRHQGSGRPSLVLVRLDPAAAAGRGELLLSLFSRLGVTNRQVLEPAGMGVYQARYVFPVGGDWGYYMRFGPGQAGFASAGVVHITPEAEAIDSATGTFHSGLRGAPGYVQTLGYAAFGLMAALSLVGVSWILARLRSLARHTAVGAAPTFSR